MSQHIPQLGWPWANPRLQHAGWIAHGWGRWRKKKKKTQVVAMCSHTVSTSNKRPRRITSLSARSEKNFPYNAVCINPEHCVWERQIWALLPRGIKKKIAGKKPTNNRVNSILNPGNSLKAAHALKLYSEWSGIRRIEGLGLDLFQSCPVLRTHFSLSLVPHRRVVQSYSSWDFSLHIHRPTFAC